MEAKHTPGPWVIGPELNSVRPGSIPVIARVRDSLRGEMHVAFVNGMAGEQDANARLIAAAPELLAALREALQSATLLGVDVGGVWDGARAALARAEGR